MTTAAPKPVPVRFSRLKLIDQSAMHYAHGFGAETDPMRKGTGLHAVLLGGAERVVVYDGGARNPRFKKWQEFQAEHADKHILSPAEMASVDGMRRSIEAHPRAMELLDNGVQENRITWDIGGRACMGTPDVVLPKGGRKRLVELKSSVSSNPDRFKYLSRKMGYHAQVAWYADGLERSMAYEHGPVDEILIIAVESKAPFPVTVFALTPRLRRKGRQQYMQWLEYLHLCEQANHWPAYVEGDVEMDDDDDMGLDWSTEAA